MITDLATAVVVCATLLPGGGETRYVDDDAPPGGDGTSWAAAYGALAPALDEALGDPGIRVVRVAGGTYRPQTRVDPPDPRSATFSMAPGLSLIGGWAGLAGPDPDQWDPAQWPTVLSGDLAMDNGPDSAVASTPAASEAGT